MAALLTTLFLGAVVGSIYSLSASGLVLTYRASGILNFSHGALGMLGAYAFYQLVDWQLPTGVALALVVFVLAPAAGVFLDVVLFRRLRDAGEVVKVVATIGLLVAVQEIAGVIWADSTLSPHSIFSNSVLEAGGFRASVDQVATVSLAIALAIALMLFLRRTSLGVTMRAVVDRPDIAELSGIDSRRVSAASWAIGTSFAALSGILLAPSFGSLDPSTLTFFIVAAAAAAVAGRLQSFPLTLAGGLGIGMAQIIVQRYAPLDISRQLRPSIPFLVLFGLLFLPQWRRRPTDRMTPPPLPPVMRALSRRDAYSRIAIVGTIAVVAPFLVDDGWQLQFARVPPMALIFLSLVVVCGFGGQVSLCQAALAGLGAFTAAHLIADYQVPFLLAVLVAGLTAVPVGVFLAFRAVNLSPLFLGFATLAFGAVTDEVLFQSGTFSGGLQGIAFQRPEWLAGSRAYYLVGLAIFGVFALLIQNLRRSQTGLALGAMRDSEVGLGALGVDVARLKLTAFALSALLAGMGGAMLSATDQLATPFTYFKYQSLILLALAVIGGIGNWIGALAGAVIMLLLPAFVHEPFIHDNVIARVVFQDKLEELLPVFFGLGAIGLARNPHGLAEQIRGLFEAGRWTRGGGGSTIPPVTALEADDTLVAVTGGTLLHRADCQLAMGKKHVRRKKSLEPCPVCQP